MVNLLQNILFPGRYAYAVRLRLRCIVRLLFQSSDCLIRRNLVLALVANLVQLVVGKVT